MLFQFKAIMDAQFQTFNAQISVASFAELSACVFSWLEEYCKPQVSLKHDIDRVYVAWKSHGEWFMCRLP